MNRYDHIVLSFLIIISAVFTGCGTSPQRILYINSYHHGYAPSDEVYDGIKEVLDREPSVVCETIFMDTKRHSDTVHVDSVVLQIRNKIDAWQPDLVIASDDNAVKWIVIPFLKDTKTPVVFCGVNWSCDAYGLPASNVTGMLEVLPLKASIELLRETGEIKTMTVLSEDTESERKNKANTQPIYDALALEVDYQLVSDFKSWKKAFIRANKKSDCVYMPTNGAIKNWDHEKAVSWVQKKIRKPVFSNDDFMMPYCTVGVTKVAKEQGTWAAKTALEILSGKPVAEIEVTENKEVGLFYNPVLVEKAGMRLTDAFLSKAREKE